MRFAATVLALAFLSCSRAPSPVGPAFRARVSAVSPAIAPLYVTLAQGQTQQFTATGTGPFTWALQGGASGSITSSGFYTAGYPGQAGATDTVTVTDTGASNTTATASVTISKGVRSFNNGGGGNGVVSGNGFPIQRNTRVDQRAAQTFQAQAPASGATTGMVTLVELDMIRVSGGAGQNIKAEIHSLTAGLAVDDQGASNALASGSVSAQTVLPTLNQKTRVIIPMTPGTALTVGTNYVLTVKTNTEGTLNAFVSATPANDTNGGVAWWYSKRYHAGGWLARGFYTSNPADYTKDSSHNLSGNVFMGEVYTAPTISSLNPTSALTGTPQFTLTIDGTNFFAASTVKWNGSTRPTTYVSPTRITATIPATDIVSQGTATVTVMTPAPGGGTSGNATFTINLSCGAGLTACSGICVNLNTDAANCGSCAHVCATAAHSSATCVAAVCGRSPCALGYFDLDGGTGAGCDWTCSGTPNLCTDGTNSLTLGNHMLPEQGAVFQAIASGSSYGGAVQTTATTTNVGVMGEPTPPVPVGNIRQTTATSINVGGLNALGPP